MFFLEGCDNFIVGPGWVEQRPDLFVEKLPMRSELGMSNG